MQQCHDSHKNKQTDGQKYFFYIVALHCVQTRSNVTRNISVHNEFENMVCVIRFIVLTVSCILPLVWMEH